MKFASDRKIKSLNSTPSHPRARACTWWELGNREGGQTDDEPAAQITGFVRFGRRLGHGVSLHDSKEMMAERATVPARVCSSRSR